MPGMNTESETRIDDAIRSLRAAERALHDGDTQAALHGIQLAGERLRSIGSGDDSGTLREAWATGMGGTDVVIENPPWTPEDVNAAGFGIDGGEKIERVEVKADPPA